MIVICEECGKKYQVDETKMRTEKAQFTCKSCGNYVSVTKPSSAPLEDTVGSAETMESETPPPGEPGSREAGSTTPPEEDYEDEMDGGGGSRKGLSIRMKMFLLFFLIPITCIAAAGWLYVLQLNNLSTTITGKSTQVVNVMAEDIIALKAKTVARQCKIYLDAHPDLKKEEFANNPEFKDIAVQSVGKTGYTALYATPDSEGVWRTWAHVNPKIIGIDMKTLIEPLGKNFPGFWRVYSGASSKKESRGYYTWQDKDGSFRDKFMVCTPVEGTDYVVAATTYMDEFTSPIQTLTTQTAALTGITRNTILSIVGGTILLIGAIVFLYGLRLTGRIKSLTDVADRISVGELDAEIEATSNDEIGELGNAVSRMQDSIRLSIERLRRRR